MQRIQSGGRRRDVWGSAPLTASSASNRLLAALASLLDLDLGHFDVEQAFVQSDLDAEMYVGLVPGRGSMSGKMVRLNKSVYGLEQASRT